MPQPISTDRGKKPEISVLSGRSGIGRFPSAKIGEIKCAAVANLPDLRRHHSPNATKKLDLKAWTSSKLNRASFTLERV